MKTASNARLLCYNTLKQSDGVINEDGILLGYTAFVGDGATQ